MRSRYSGVPQALAKPKVTCIGSYTADKVVLSWTIYILVKRCLHMMFHRFSCTNATNTLQCPKTGRRLLCCTLFNCDSDIRRSVCSFGDTKLNDSNKIMNLQMSFFVCVICELTFAMLVFSLVPSSIVRCDVQSYLDQCVSFLLQ